MIMMLLRKDETSPKNIMKLSNEEVHAIVLFE
jgi:hypothetical protein